MLIVYAFQDAFFYLLRTELRKGINQLKMATNNSNTNYELWQKLGKMEADIQNVGKQVELIGTKIDRMDLAGIVQRLVKLETDFENHEQRIKQNTDNQSKVVWLVIVAVVSAILKTVIIDRGLTK